MPRVKRGNKRRQKRKKILDLASGYRLTKGKLYRAAAEARKHEISYSRLIAGLKKAGINLNRKMLAEIAVSDSAGFAHLAQIAKTA